MTRPETSPPIKDGVSGYYNYVNRNKRSITLNLKSEKGRAAAMELAAQADIIVENFSAGTIAKLGLGYEDVKKVNPEVVFASLSGFGQYGPYKNKLAYDAIAQAMGGLTSLSGEPERPCKVTPALSDAITGIHMAFAVMVAAYHKLHTGKGQYIDVAMMDKAKIPSAPIMTIGRPVDDPHIAAREMMIEQEDPILGKVRYPGNPLKLSETPAQFTRRAPRLGEHNVEVLRDILHYSDEQIQAMKDAGDIGE